MKTYLILGFLGLSITANGLTSFSRLNELKSTNQDSKLKQKSAGMDFSIKDSPLFDELHSNHKHGVNEYSHTCIHNKIQQDILQSHVNYNNHPIERKRRLKNLEESISNLDTSQLDNTQKEEEIKYHRRRLAVSEDEYEPIRITPYWIHLEEQVTDAAMLTYMKELTTASIEFFANSANVYPVDTALFLTPDCNYGYDPFNDESYWNCASGDDSWDARNICGHVTIPDEHFGTGWEYDGELSQASLHYSGGSGIANSDLVIYVSANDSSCDDGTLAWATACQTDQYGRPIAGAINFCTDSLSPDFWKLNVDTTLHELTHVLIYDPSIWAGFIDMSSGAELGAENVYTTIMGDSGNTTYIITEKVKALAQVHYDCDSIIGLPVEDDGGSGSVGAHWEEYHVNTEYMIAVLYSSATYVSYFTFALMEDSGWYIVDYNYVEPYFWGKDVGCDFWDGTCIDSSTEQSLFPQYFCDTDSTYGCTYEHSATAECLIYQNQSIPEQFQWFSDVKAGGTDLSQYCPFMDAILKKNDFYGYCWDERGNNKSYQDTYTQNYPVEYSINSRCVTTINKDGSSNNDLEYGLCFKHTCWGYSNYTVNLGDVLDYNIGQYKGVLIEIYGEFINCTRDEQGTTKNNPTYQIDITCPDVDAICFGETPFDCYWGYWNNNWDSCTCSAGYQGDTCEDEISNVLEQLTLYSGNTPSPTASDIVCVKSLTFLEESLDGEWASDGVYGVYESYISPNGDYYLWFDTWYHEWVISNQFTFDSDGWVDGIIAFCDLGRFYIPDVTDCNQDWTVWDDTNQLWYHDYFMITSADNCPDSPTSSPTDLAGQTHDATQPAETTTSPKEPRIDSGARMVVNKIGVIGSLTFLFILFVYIV